MRARPDDRSSEGGDVDVSVVVPLFNEEETLRELHRRLSGVLEGLKIAYEIILVDDGSRDGTPALIDELLGIDPHVVAFGLSRNFGHQAAVSAGLDHARGRAVVVMDGDLQDPPEFIPELVRLWREGFDVVYAVRKLRKEAAWKRLGYFAFYRLFRALSDLDVPVDSGDFSLLDRRVVDALNQLPERLRFIRGLRAFVGFRQVGLVYEREAREAGRSKYSVGDLAALAVDGLVSFSGRPLRLVTHLGLASAGIAAALMAWVFADALSGGRSTPRGWASIVAVVLFMGAIQLISLGIIGEYIRLIFLESKGRPTYIVMDHRIGRRESRALRVDSGRPLADPRPSQGRGRTRDWSREAARTGEGPS